VVDFVRWLKGRFVDGTASIDGDGASGFVYVADGETGPMASASAGMCIDNFSDRPPWIVVDHKAESIVLAKWPGRLWRVHILRKASEQPLAYAGYTRATAVQIEQEVPLAALFEYKGEDVVDFLSSIRSLSFEAKAALEQLSDERAVALHNEVWNRWLSQVDPASPYLGQDHSGIIAMGAKSSRSPVGNATSVLHSELTIRARELDGQSAFVTDSEGQWFNPQWLRVATHLQHALFAIGVPEQLLSLSERIILAKAYRYAVPARKQSDDV
jgi:hypothetical protein